MWLKIRAFLRIPGNCPSWMNLTHISLKFPNKSGKYSPFLSITGEWFSTSLQLWIICLSHERRRIVNVSAVGRECKHRRQMNIKACFRTHGEALFCRPCHLKVDPNQTPKIYTDTTVIKPTDGKVSWNASWCKTCRLYYFNVSSPQWVSYAY
jgi:hypothetical protein